MRFWPPFHTYSLDIISDSRNKLIFRAPNCVHLQMTAEHLESNQNPGSCFTHFNHDTYLWECYHSPQTIGHHRLFIWLLDSYTDSPWALAVRFDVHIEARIESLYYPIATNLFNELRCQLIRPINGILSRNSLPQDIIIRVPCVNDVQLHIDENTLVEGNHLQNDVYSMKIPSSILNHVKNFLVMALCSDNNYYSLLITYKIE